MSRHDVNAGRFYVDAFGGQRVELPADQAHHASHVLRLPVGAEVELFDGRGGLAVGTIAEVARGRVVVAVQRVKEALVRPRPTVHLAFAVPKGKRLDWLLEKATELGAASLRPIVFQRSVAGGDELTESKLDRWSGHCIAAAKQCGLNFLPEILPHERLEQYLALPREGRCVLGDVGADVESLAAVLASGGDAWSEIHLLVGPEGGLTEEERGSAAAGFRPARLGHTTLRVETAAVALLAATVAFYERRD